MDFMRHLTGGALLGVLALSGCSHPTDEEKNAPLEPLDAYDAGEFDDVVLNFAEPEQAVAFFRDHLAENPGNAEYRRGFALSLMRANRNEEAVVAWAKLVDAGQATKEDRVNYAETLVRTDKWDEARKQLDAVPPTYETYERYLLEALMSDRAKTWEKSDSFYANARGLTTRPASVLNNWGISNLARGNYQRAEELFLESITYDDKLFNPKNNLVISRGKQGNYRLPIMAMTTSERAQLLYNLGVEAVRNGDIDIAKGLFAEALETSPTYFSEAAAALDSLNNSVTISDEIDPSLLGVELPVPDAPEAPELPGTF